MVQPDMGSSPRSTTLEASMLAITTLMRFIWVNISWEEDRTYAMYIFLRDYDCVCYTRQTHHWVGFYC